MPAFLSFYRRLLGLYQVSRKLLGGIVWGFEPLVLVEGK